jgi:hypothetical protein
MSQIGYRKVHSDDTYHLPYGEIAMRVTVSMCRLLTLTLYMQAFLQQGNAQLLKQGLIRVHKQQHIRNDKLFRRSKKA